MYFKARNAQPEKQSVVYVLLEYMGIPKNKSNKITVHVLPVHFISTKVGPTGNTDITMVQH